MKLIKFYKIHKIIFCIFLFIFVFFPKFLFASSDSTKINDETTYKKLVFNGENGKIEQKTFFYKYGSKSSYLSRKEYLRNYHKKRNSFKKKEKEKISEVTKSFFTEEIYMSTEEQSYRDSKTLPLLK
ncbi:hypothetical protein AXA84_0399 [Candidatus Phytoplasma oryzae]|uniref:Uncharacterized protein n=1 Tax=Candidatus Phytoplasma oryzae TaxID=203274 RepID=A0A139JQ27_9MOLU|nr:hypothetical protein [Candidatus Phytoplasma oryzae]KXT29081.1 hypothetical protein AXA84_0399 [Candidatus Phytoplasma oryzae]RAM57688.1 hypothetical protein DH96_01895 [Candidatus Phytoplasma oryzae]